MRGAEPGDSLVAEILDVRPVEWGVATLIPGFGQLDRLVDMPVTLLFEVICFTGVEIAGEVDIRFELRKGKQATWPVTELADRWVPHATAADYADALQLVSEEAAKLPRRVLDRSRRVQSSVGVASGVAQAATADGSRQSGASRSRSSRPARGRFARSLGRVRNHWTRRPFWP